MVIVIIGVLSTIAVPIYSNHSIKAKTRAAAATVKAELNKAVVIATSNGSYTDVSGKTLKVDLKKMIDNSKFPENVYVDFFPSSDGKGRIRVDYGGLKGIIRFSLDADLALYSGNATLNNSCFIAGKTGYLTYSHQSAGDNDATDDD